MIPIDCVCNIVSDATFSVDLTHMSLTMVETVCKIAQIVPTILKMRVGSRSETSDYTLFFQTSVHGDKNKIVSLELYS